MPMIFNPALETSQKEQSLLCFLKDAISVERSCKGDGWVNQKTETVQQFQQMIRPTDGNSPVISTDFFKANSDSLCLIDI